MIRLLWVSTGFLLVLSGCSAVMSDSDSGEDPWRWLEQGAQAPRVADWLDWQWAMTDQWFTSAAQAVDTDRIRSALDARWQQSRLTLPRRYGDHHFLFHNTGADDHYAFYRLAAAGAVRLIDPADWPNGDRLEQVSVSPDGQHLLYLRYRADDNAHVWFLRPVPVADGQGDLAGQPLDLPAELQPGWHPDGRGFYFIDGTTDCQIRFMAVATGAGSDNGACPFAHREGRPVSLQYKGTSDELILRWQGADGGQKWLVSSAAGDSEAHEVLLKRDAQWFRFVGRQQQKYYFINYRDSWHGHLVSAELVGGRILWQDEVPPTQAHLRRVLLTRQGILLEYIEHAVSALYFQDFSSGDVIPVPLPTYGRIGDAALSADTDRVYLQFDGLVQSSMILRFDPASAAMTEIWQAPQSVGRVPLVVQRHFVEPESTSGRSAPVYLAGREDVLMRGPQPLLMETYGGFNLPVDTGYSLSRAAWMDMGGLYALAVVRGGGEYDESWYLQGSGLNRQQSVNDLLFIADFLVQRGVTTADRFALGGRSHGATLAAAAVAESPQRFGALIADAGVMDLMRYPVDGAGVTWLQEYGDPSDEQAARALRDFSPYHRALQHGEDCHPPVLVIASAGDPVVSAWHSYKYVAALQQRRLVGAAPVLLAGSVQQTHSETGPVSSLVDDYTRRWQFLQLVLSMGAGQETCG